MQRRGFKNCRKGKRTGKLGYDITKKRRLKIYNHIPFIPNFS